MEVYSGEKPYIFISYAHSDANVVVPTIEFLQNNGFRVWYDKGIEAGTEWPQNIAEHLAAASCIMIFMSHSAADSHNCRNEINLASELKKEMFIIHLEDFEMSLGLRLQLNLSQAIYRNRFNNINDFYNELLKAKIIQAYKDDCDLSENLNIVKNFIRTNEVKDGVYNIQNVHSGYMMNIYSGRDTNGTRVTVWKQDNSDDQKIYISHQTDGRYLLKYYGSSSGRVIDVNRGQKSTDSIEVGNVVDIWSPDDLDAQLFYINKYHNGEYLFELVSKPGCVLAPSGMGASKTNGSQLILDTNKEEDYQRWNLKPVADEVQSKKSKKISKLWKRTIGIMALLFVFIAGVLLFFLNGSNGDEKVNISNVENNKNLITDYDTFYAMLITASEELGCNSYWIPSSLIDNRIVEQDDGDVWITYYTDSIAMEDVSLHIGFRNEGEEIIAILNNIKLENENVAYKLLECISSSVNGHYLTDFIEVMTNDDRVPWRDLEISDHSIWNEVLQLDEPSYKLQDENMDMVTKTKTTVVDDLLIHIEKRTRIYEGEEFLDFTILYEKNEQ